MKEESSSPHRATQDGTVPEGSHTQTAAQDQRPTRLPYRAPSLAVFGALGALTQSLMLTVGNDGNTGMFQKTH